MGPIRSGRTKNRREPGGPSSAMADEQTDISNTTKIKLLCVNTGVLMLWNVT